MVGLGIGGDTGTSRLGEFLLSCLNQSQLYVILNIELNLVCEKNKLQATTKQIATVETMCTQINRNFI